MIDGFGGAIIPDAICGGRHESQLEGYSEEIKSKDIIEFEYAGTKAYLYAKKEDNKLLLTARGGSSSGRRDGTYFKIRLENDDFSILEDLQKVIEEHNIIRGNGHCVHVDGLPDGIGDRLSVEYKSGEKIYKESNQSLTISFDAADAIYDVFQKYVQKYGLDFTSKGSNQQLYDDADEDYLQGTWNGKHFGREISVTINKNHITITVDGKVTDDEDYIIYEGTVVSNRLREVKEKQNSYYDYEYFNGVSILKKKNWFTMTGYFLGDSYSTCDLMNFDKEKPKDLE